MNLLTKTKAELLKITVPEREFYNIGELFPTIFDSDGQNIQDNLNVKISHFGNFNIANKYFKKLTCPICGKVEGLIPYFCGGSAQSEGHVIKFFCSECKEHIAVNNKKDYFNEIKDFVLDNRKKKSAG